MNSTDTAPAPRRRGSLLLIAIVVALVVLFLWMRRDNAPEATVAIPAPAEPAPAPARPTYSSTDSSLPPGAHWEQGILLDAAGNRILNAAGLPPGPPIPVAKPIPIQAAPGDIVGYTVDANGVSHPLRADSIKSAANTPGTYAAVDIWADGGPAVVAPTQGVHLTAQQVEKLRAAERARDQAQAQGNR
ncbi:MAG: hypothetical protein ABIP44_10570 [Pseudoxanthomonas sp.]